jgi:cysteinyl-tRNA synthetase
VWKASGEDEIGWDSPWGRGRPGWHIECSAMSMNILGETFDIHGGGMDLIFPHHENEIAQSEAASGRPFAKYWMHNGLTRVKTKASGGKRAEKMSKSLGNIRELRELLPAWGGETVRAFILSTHYRRPLDFSDEQLAATQKSLENFYRLFEDVERLSGQDPYATADAVDLRDAEWMQTVLADDARQIAPSVQGFFETMADDFNTAAAIAALHELRNIATQWRNDITHGVADERRTASVLQVAALVIALGRIVGLFERRPATKKVDLSEDEIQALIDERTAARENKDFARADAIRDELASKGVSLEDLPSGTIWRRA